MPTRYTVDFDVKKPCEKGLGPENIKDARKDLKKMFEDKYRNQSAKAGDKKAAGTAYFFTKLRF